MTQKTECSVRSRSFSQNKTKFDWAKLKLAALVSEAALRPNRELQGIEKHRVLMFRHHLATLKVLTVCVCVRRRFFRRRDFF